MCKNVDNSSDDVLFLKSVALNWISATLVMVVLMLMVELYLRTYTFKTCKNTQDAWIVVLIISNCDGTFSLCIDSQQHVDFCYCHNVLCEPTSAYIIVLQKHVPPLKQDLEPEGSVTITLISASGCSRLWGSPGEDRSSWSSGNPWKIGTSGT